MQYAPLEYVHSETRFLRVTSVIDSLEFDVHVASLDTPLEYNALSYCWDIGRGTLPIKVDGKTIQVQRNLADALPRCGLEIGQLIWVDALCIDQMNKFEKTYQVGMMGRIYARAKKTFSWVGMEGLYAIESLEFLKTLQSTGWKPGMLKRGKMSCLACQQQEIQCTFNKSNGPDCKACQRDRRQCDFSKSAAERHSLARVLRLLETPTRALLGLRELLNRPYWQRIWIVQEVAKSPVVEVRYGSYHFDMDLLLAAANAVHGLSETIASNLSTLLHFRTQEQMHDWSYEPSSLINALMATRYFRATEPRDKIFALLGLTKDGRELIQLPSYEDSVEKINRFLSLAILKSPQTTNLLLIQPFAIVAGEVSRGQMIVDWLNLHDVPKWLMPITDVRDVSAEWFIDRDGRSIYVAAQKIGQVAKMHQQHDYSPDCPHSITGDDEQAIEVVGLVCHGILARLSPFSLVAPNVSIGALTDALARMIRNAHKGSHKEKYDFDGTRNTLLNLGDLLIQGNPLWDWVREYNYARMKAREVVSANSELVKVQSSDNPDERPTKRAKLALQVTGVESSASGEGEIDPIAFRAWEEMLFELDGSAEFALRFAMLEPHHELVLVSRKTSSYDLIYQLDCCLLPVVLRADDHSNSFRVVGEVCLGKRSDGAWIRGLEASQSGFPFEDQDARRITIELGPL